MTAIAERLDVHPDPRDLIADCGDPGGAFWRFVLAMVLATQIAGAITANRDMVRAFRTPRAPITRVVRTRGE